MHQKTPFLHYLQEDMYVHENLNYTQCMSLLLLGVSLSTGKMRPLPRVCIVSRDMGIMSRFHKQPQCFFFLPLKEKSNMNICFVAHRRSIHLCCGQSYMHESSIARFRSKCDLSPYPSENFTFLEKLQFFLWSYLVIDHL